MAKTIVIISGGYHPYHAGHYALYQSAKKAFPDAEVYVAATNDTSQRPFPFPIKEKLAKLAGVEPGHFVQVKSPFRAKEITKRYDPATTQLIFVRSEKDSTKPPLAGGVKKDGAPAYLQPITDQLAPMSQHAYMAYLPTVEFGPGMTSATEIRSAWPTLNQKRKTALVMSLYPKTQNNPKLAATVVKMLDTAIVAPHELTEAFDKPYEILRWEKGDFGDVDAIARLDDNTFLSIMFNKGVSKDSKEETWSVEFYRNNSQEVTGKGDAQRVFATVISAMQTFIKKYTPNRIIFTASKEVEPGQNAQSRARLYDSLVQRYARVWGFRAFRADTGNKVIYELTKITQDVSENRDSVSAYKKRNSKNLSVDTELNAVKNYAQRHYPALAADPESAFDKWVARSLAHSDVDDHDQDKKLRQLATEISDLKTKIQSLKQQLDSADYLDESK